MLTSQTLELAKLMHFPFKLNKDDLPETGYFSHNEHQFTRRKIPGLTAGDRLDILLAKLQEEYPEFAVKVSEYAEDVTMEEEIQALINSTVGLEDFLKDFFKNNKKDKKNKEDSKDTKKSLAKQIITLTGNQMLYGIKNPIPAGSKLYACDYLLPGYGDDDLYEATFHAYMETMLNRPFIGGLAAKGFGRVEIEVRNKDGENFEQFSRAGEYWQWLEDNKETVREYLINIDQKIFLKKSVKSA